MTESNKHRLLLFLILGSLVLLMLQAPIKQDQAYHNFTDTRTLFGIANFYNVASNIPFLFLGMLGVFHCRSLEAGSLRVAWLIFFIGIGLVSVGSAYYHLNPNNATLVWDRLPMTIGFMGLFAALLGEWVDPKVTKYALLPLVLLGLISVLVWRYSDDLRLYAWVQFMPLLVIPALLALYRKRYSHSYMLALAILFYVLAKVLEAFDAEVFALLQTAMAGHAIKHLLAAVSCGLILWMLKIRAPIEVE